MKKMLNKELRKIIGKIKVLRNIQNQEGITNEGFLEIDSQIEELIVQRILLIKLQNNYKPISFIEWIKEQLVYRKQRRSMYS